MPTVRATYKVGLQRPRAHLHARTATIYSANIKDSTIDPLAPQGNSLWVVGGTRWLLSLNFNPNNPQALAGLGPHCPRHQGQWVVDFNQKYPLTP